MGDAEEQKPETEFSAVITTDEKVAHATVKEEQDKGHKARVEKRADGFHVLVEIVS